MSRQFGEDYYHRKCYLEKDQVPTQSIMIKKMSPPLAKVYFKSMNSNLKRLAGLEPPMKGGGNDWYMPPKDLLEGRAVLKPVKKEHISKLGFSGIDFLSYRLRSNHRNEILEAQRKALEENDASWKSTIILECHKYWDTLAKEASEFNTKTILDAFRDFTNLYTSSLTKIENMLFESAVKEINRTKEATYQKMKKRYENLIEKQARVIYSKYTNKLEAQKQKRKADFISQVETMRSDLCKELHEINYEKHVTLEKVRNYLENQNLACQLYVALKEHEECEKEINERKEEHEKKVKSLKDNIAMQNLEINRAKEKEKERKDFESIWRKKACHVVKTFQKFISYCLHSMPEYAEFFVNMEKLLMLQLSEAMDNPEAESVIEPEKPGFHTPIPKPHPFYLFCDEGFRPNIDDTLCPKHCTSSASQLPVIVVNKRCIYSACDNLSLLGDKLEQFVRGTRDEDVDVEDNEKYENYVPIKYTDSRQLMELKLESSIMQILKAEIPNHQNMPIYCCDCHMPHCFLPHSLVEGYCKSMEKKPEPKPVTPPPPIPYDPGDIITSRSIELRHYREPKLESYCDFVAPRQCKCKKLAKKNLRDHLPPYMINVSKYENAHIHGYVKCPLETLRHVVKKAKNAPKTPSPSESVELSYTKDASTQYEDLEYEKICTCFSDEALKDFFATIAKERISNVNETHFKVVNIGGSQTDFDPNKNPEDFITEQALELKRLIVASPQLEELFKRPDCTNDDQ